MKFGFNTITPEAEEQLWQDGLRVVKEDEGHVAVYTDSITSEVENRDIDLPRHTFGQVVSEQGEYQRDAAYAMAHDRVHMLVERTCDCPTNSNAGGFYRCIHPRRYFYLFGGRVYTSLPKRISDNSTDPPTIFETTELELVKDPGSIRDRLLSVAPTVKGMLF